MNSDKKLDKAIEKQAKEFEKWHQEFNKAKNADEIIDVLSKNKTGSCFNIKNPAGKKAIDKLLKFGKDKNVELAIAKYYPDTELREKLFFNSKNRKTKLACLEAESWLPLWQSLIGSDDKKYPKFLKEANDEELYAYFTNKNFDIIRIEKIINREKPYDKIAEKKYRNIILILEDNPNTKKEPDMTDYEEGFDFYTNSKAYELFQKELTKVKKLNNLE